MSLGPVLFPCLPSGSPTPRVELLSNVDTFSWQWWVTAWEGKGCQSHIFEVLERPPPSEVWDWEPCSGWNHRAIYSQKLSALQISTVRKSGKHNQGSWENQAVDKAVNCSILCTQVLRALSKSALKHCLTWTAVKAISPMLSRIVLSNDNKRVGTLEITS